MTIKPDNKQDDMHKDAHKMPIKQVRRRFFFLLAVALILISVLVWLTIAVLKVNNIEPFGEIAISAFLSYFV